MEYYLKKHFSEALLLHRDLLRSYCYSDVRESLRWNLYLLEGLFPNFLGNIVITQFSRINLSRKQIILLTFKQKMSLTFKQINNVYFQTNKLCLPLKHQISLSLKEITFITFKTSNEPAFL